MINITLSEEEVRILIDSMREVIYSYDTCLLHRYDSSRHDLTKQEEARKESYINEIMIATNILSKLGVK